MAPFDPAPRDTTERDSGPGTSGVVSVAGAVGWVTAGSMVANICAYAVHLAAGRWWLSPAEYGELAVLLSAQLVMAVPGLAVQSVVARDVVRGRGPDEIRRLTAWVVVVVAAVAAVLTPAVAAITSTSVAASAAALASAPMLAVIGAGQGVAQGGRRFHLLAAMLAGVGVARLGPMMVALGMGAGPVGALSAGSVGAAVAAVGVLFGSGLVSMRSRPVARRARPALSRSALSRPALSRSAPSATPGSRPAPSRAAGLLDVAAAGQVQLVLIVASSIDLLLSRHALAPSVAGVYALGAIATKVAFWLPQAIGVVFYPQLAHPSSSQRSLRQALTVVIAVGAVLTALAGVAGPLVPILITDDYRALTGILWLFAYTGAALAVLQVALLSAIARNATSASVIAWVVVAAEVVVIVGVGPVHADSLIGLAATAAVAATVSAVTTTVWCLRVAGRRIGGDRTGGGVGVDPTTATRADVDPARGA